MHVNKRGSATSAKSLAATVSSTQQNYTVQVGVEIQFWEIACIFSFPPSLCWSGPPSLKTPQRDLIFVRSCLPEGPNCILGFAFNTAGEMNRAAGGAEECGDSTHARLISIRCLTLQLPPVKWHCWKTQNTTIPICAHAHAHEHTPTYTHIYCTSNTLA